jgi:hypothetical protein
MEWSFPRSFGPQTKKKKGRPTNRGTASKKIEDAI